MRCATVILTTVVSCFSICPLGARMQDAAEHPLARDDGSVLVPQWVRGLLSERHTFDSLSQDIDRVRKQPLYLRLSAASSLVDLMVDRNVVALHHYSPNGDHDLRLIAGRAAFAIDRLFPISVPTITRDTVPEDLARLAEAVRQQLDAYRLGVLAVVNEYQIGEDHARLAQTYQERIHEGIPEADRTFFFTTRGASDFRECLDAFFPIGKRLDDLEAIVGADARLEESIHDGNDTTNGVQVVAYYARDSRFAIAYRFLIHDGVIESVSISADE